LAVIVFGPRAFVEKLTEHADTPAPTEPRMQLGEPRVPAEALKLMLPAGLLAPAPEVSLTVAVQIVDPSLIGIEAGLQFRLVLVDRLTHVTDALPFAVSGGLL
jgi:hypothetical protein